jgi:SAM-dependent methyltransferase
MRLDLTAYVRLTELADYIVPFAVRVAADLGVADCLVDGPLSTVDIAERTGADPRSLQRVLRALASRRIFAEVTPGVYGLTPLAQPLRSDHPLSLRAAYPLLAAEVTAWAHAHHSVRTGEPAFDHAHGVPYYDWFTAHRDQGVRVDALQAAATALHLRTLLPAYDWGALSTVVDVGGGNGTFLAGLLAKVPGLHGTVIDLPDVVAAAPAVFEAVGVADRATVRGGDFFEDVPAGADAYVLKTVLPGWRDERATALLRVVRKAMRPDSRVVALEAVPPPGDEFDVAKLFDVQTLVMAGGGHRTREELATLFAAAGLRLVDVTPTATLAVVEAVAG